MLYGKNLNFLTSFLVNVTSGVSQKALLTGTELSSEYKFKCNSRHLSLTLKCSQLKFPSKCININQKKMFDNHN